MPIGLWRASNGSWHQLNIEAVNFASASSRPSQKMRGLPLVLLPMHLRYCFAASLQPISTAGRGASSSSVPMPVMHALIKTLIQGGGVGLVGRDG